MDGCNVKSEMGSDGKKRSTVAKSSADLFEFGRGGAFRGHSRNISYSIKSSSA